MTAESFVIRIENDAISAAVWCGDHVIRDGIRRMEIEYEDQVFPLEHDGLVHLVHVELVSEQ